MKKITDEIKAESTKAAISAKPAEKPAKIDEIEASRVAEAALERRLAAKARKDGYTLMTDEKTGEQYACYRVGETLEFVAIADIANKKFNLRYVYIPAEIDPDGVLLPAATVKAIQAYYNTTIETKKSALARSKDIVRVREIMEQLAVLHYQSRNGADRNAYKAAFRIEDAAGNTDTYAERIASVVAYYLYGGVDIGFDFTEFAADLSAPGLSNTKRLEILKRLCGWLKGGYTVESRIKPVNAVVRTADAVDLYKSFYRGLARKNGIALKTAQNDKFIQEQCALFMVDLFQKNGADEKRFARLVGEREAAKKAAFKAPAANPEAKKKPAPKKSTSKKPATKKAPAANPEAKKKPETTEPATK